MTTRLLTDTVLPKIALNSASFEIRKDAFPSPSGSPASPSWPIAQMEMSLRMSGHRAILGIDITIHNPGSTEPDETQTAPRLVQDLKWSILKAVEAVLTPEELQAPSGLEDTPRYYPELAQALINMKKLYGMDKIMQVLKREV